MLQLQAQFGVSAHELQPIERIRTVGISIFVIAGTEDQHTTLAESLRLFGAANPPKEWWGFEGAVHVDLHRFAPQVYEERVLEFFARTLRQKRSPRSKGMDDLSTNVPESSPSESS